MQKNLYFDIGDETTAGSLYKMTGDDGKIHFLYQHSTYDSDKDESAFFDTSYVDFEAFWKMLVSDKKWFYKHPLFVHPEKRDFVQDQLKNVNWDIVPDKKWQISHQRQWTKVLTDPGNYYRG